MTLASLIWGQGRALLFQVLGPYRFAFLDQGLASLNSGGTFRMGGGHSPIIKTTACADVRKKRGLGGQAWTLNDTRIRV